jgi:hypothetical protein
MKIDILVFDGCPSAESTCSLVRQIVEEENVQAEIVIKEVNSLEDARPYRFLGSPTVYVNGLDIESARRDEANDDMSCRIYRTPQGSSGVPPVEMIRQAIRSASA